MTMIHKSLELTSIPSLKQMGFDVEINSINKMIYNNWTLVFECRKPWNCIIALHGGKICNEPNV